MIFIYVHIMILNNILSLNFVRQKSTAVILVSNKRN